MAKTPEEVPDFESAANFSKSEPGRDEKSWKIEKLLGSDALVIDNGFNLIDGVEIPRSAVIVFYVEPFQYDVIGSTDNSLEQLLQFAINVKRLATKESEVGI